MPDKIKELRDIATKAARDPGVLKPTAPDFSVETVEDLVMVNTLQMWSK